MTGFGKGEASFGTKKITVELRSLNSKQLDLNIKLPALYRQSETELRNLVSQRLQRGKVDVFVTVESQQTETSAHINKEVLAAYAAELREAARYAKLNDAGVGYDSAALQVLMRLPDVVSVEAERVTEEESAALLAAATDAVERLDAFRVQEGAVLIADLLRRVDLIETIREEVVPFEKARTETIRARILDNLSKLGVEVDRNRLEQEMIYYLEKLDITEEKVRLANHCRYFREVAAGEEAPGRKLGFIAQEMGREINTMGSKANESNIQILVVRMKDELEKIKEQVLNIL
ncbi:YicC/YloC family endoribonuclease [uncultured Alistipes sp.]|uniref:YicC/YloC family endoribonuclease n=1 Tax=uncultured Alistipes sp. TaxID=538949 RepID=UPI002805228B|nr:YicC/YloC family endoribonuclease [uncultured Alistipes sp.]